MSPLILVAISISILISITSSQSVDDFGPFYYPNGSSNDTSWFTMGRHNESHLYLNILVTGNRWFGMAFANSHYPDGCTPNSGCTGPITGAGCVSPETAITGCKMDGSDAIIYGNYGGTQKLTAMEWTLGNHSAGTLHPAQNGIDLYFYQELARRDQDNWYSVYIIRPFDPSLPPHFDRHSYKITYPFAGDFCWLWAFGENLHFATHSIHQFAGYQCINFGGTTNAPTPTPSYAPTPGPTSDPTIKPTKAPSHAGDTPKPSMSPTTPPTGAPTQISKTPTESPTRIPTPGPTVIAGEPTKSPTLRPTPAPTEEPTSNPTPEPTPPYGQTKKPTKDPTLSPTTAEPTLQPSAIPTPSPTFIQMDEDFGDTTSDTSWLEENLTWILLIAVVAVIACFCCAVFCFWCNQQKRTEQRREKRQKALDIEKFKIEQGLNIDADNQTKRNRAIAKRTAAMNKKRNRMFTGSGNRSRSVSASGFVTRSKYSDLSSSTEESDDFYLDRNVEHGFGDGNEYETRNSRYRVRGNDDEKAEIHTTPGHGQDGDQGGGMNTESDDVVRKRKYKPAGKGRRERGRGINTGKARLNGGSVSEEKSKFVSMDDDEPRRILTANRKAKYKPRGKSKNGRYGRPSTLGTDASDLDNSD